MFIRILLLSKVKGKTGLLIAIGLFLVFSSVMRIVFLILDWKRDQRLFSEGVVVNAVITDRITYPDADDLQSSQYRLIAEYKDERGDKHYVRSRGHMCGAESREMIGRNFDIVYAPDHPEHSIFLADKKAHISYWAIFGNAIGILAGLLLISIFLFSDQRP